jgi:hypothetical protein
VIKPAINIAGSKATTLEYIEGKIEENVSANLTRAGVQIASSRNPNPRCIQLENFLLVMEITPPYPVIVKNETGGIESAYAGNGVEFANLVIDRKNKNNRFFEVYFSSALAGLDVSTMPCNSIVSDYTISLIRTNKYVFEKNMYKLLDYYRNNYEDLKKEFKIPPGNEFGFGFKQSNGTIIEVGGKGTADIYAREIPVQYFDDKANVQSSFINVRVW